jgi:NAD+ synthase (glutamine-hydrolysing)
MTKLALAQINPTVGDIPANGAKIIEYIRAAHATKAAIVIFPELALTGYPPEDLLLKTSFINAASAELDKIAKTSGGIWAVVGVPIHEGGKLYNAAAILHAGKIVEYVYKTELPNYGVFDEKRYFSKAPYLKPVKMAGIKTAVTICEDIWTEDGTPVKLAAEPEVELIINISSSPFHTGKSDQRRAIATSLAGKAAKPLAYCNLVGGQDELVFDGGSFVCDGKGDITASAKEFEEDILFVDLGIANETAEEVRPDNRITPQLGYPENVSEALKLGVRDYIGKNGFNGVVIALSGGIDSALTAAIAAEALGSDAVWGIAMPSKYSSKSSLDDAGELAENLGIRFDVIPITGLMDKFAKTLSDVFSKGAPEGASGNGPGIAEENIQARIRGTLIMALSNRFGVLPLTTGNKSELSVGYCTLYGDMAGGFSVIKDLPKLMVYELSKWINTRQESDVIPQNTISKEPSAELRPNQKDSDSLPDYNKLDPMLKLYVEEEKSIEEIISLGYIGEETQKIVRLVDRSEYKRRQAAPGIKITPKAFGKDRRMPITNRYTET